MNFKFFLLISVIAVFMGCTSSNKKKIYFVQEYKILNDSVTKYYGHFATVEKMDNRFDWVKLLTHYNYNDFNMVDSIICSDSINFVYSLNETFDVDKVYNWKEIRLWSKSLIDTLFSEYKLDITPEIQGLLSMSTDSTLFINKNLPEIAIHNTCLYLNYLKENHPDSLTNYQTDEDENFLYYTLESDVQEDTVLKALSIFDDALSDNIKLESIKENMTLYYSKNKKEFISGAFERSFNYGLDRMKLLFRIYEVDSINNYTVNFYEERLFP